ncbi:MAG: tRNA (adenosine(37)-N6)-dimethylallyltransferase MiaA [Ignavibacteriaceae bacterium]
MERKVIVILGPTCSGKTSLGILLAQKLNGEIISADSRQIYKDLNIGTAKPSKEELKNTKHHLINFLDMEENYNASKFEQDSIKICRNLFKKNKIPIVVGGSGLYIKALVDGIIDSAEIDEEYRKKLLKFKEEFGNEFLHNKLKKVDIISAEKIHPAFWKRVIRALEVYHLTGKPIWQHHNEQKKRKINFQFSQRGLKWEREILYKNIEFRVDEMIENGLVEEVKILISKGFNKNINSLNTVGYKEIFSYLDGEISLGKAIELIKRNTRRFAKRQFTWFTADDRIVWHNIESQKDLNKIADEIIRREGLNG